MATRDRAGGTTRVRGCGTGSAERAVRRVLPGVMVGGRCQAEGNGRWKQAAKRSLTTLVRELLTVPGLEGRLWQTAEGENAPTPFIEQMIDIPNRFNNRCCITTRPGSGAMRGSGRRDASSTRNRRTSGLCKRRFSPTSRSRATTRSRASASTRSLRCRRVHDLHVSRGVIDGRYVVVRRREVRRAAAQCVQAALV